MKIDLENKSNKLLFLLLLADFVFIIIHCVFRLHLLLNARFSIEQDFGYAEIYQFIKEYWVVVLLFIAAVKRRHFIYFSWALLFLYLLFDDVFQFHETLACYFASCLNLPSIFHLRAQDIGELGVSVFFGFLLFAFIWVLYLFSDRAAKQLSRHLFILVALLAFFGVLVDMLHIVLPWGESILALIEDGGEMLMMSIIVWYVFNLKFDAR
ncbi:MAG: hypothetical protein JXB40_01220 [Candidatus Omnitrophica bacterium]|nr:hypothetical protein [Candidatus Omnitrophota bacterium]